MLKILCFHISASRSICAVPNMAVFCNSLMWFPGTLLRYCLNDFDVIPVAHIITYITFVFTVHMRCISILRSSYYYYYYYYYSKKRTVLQQLTVITLTIHIFYTSQNNISLSPFKIWAPFRN